VFVVPGCRVCNAAGVVWLGCRGFRRIRLAATVAELAKKIDQLLARDGPTRGIQPAGAGRRRGVLAPRPTSMWRAASRP